MWNLNLFHGEKSKKVPAFFLYFFLLYVVFLFTNFFFCVLMFLNVGLFQLLLIDSVGILVVSVMLKCGSWSCSTTFYRKGWVYG